MRNLLKMERYQLSHNFFYWCGFIGIFFIGFFTAETYVPEVMGPTGGAATSLVDIFNGMVYDSTFLLIIISYSIEAKRNGAAAVRPYRIRDWFGLDTVPAMINVNKGTIFLGTCLSFPFCQNLRLFSLKY